MKLHRCAHQHDGKTDDLEQRQQLGQIAKMIAALLTGLRLFGSFKQFKIFIGKFSSLNGGDSDLHVSQHHHDCPEKHRQPGIEEFCIVNSHHTPLSGFDTLCQRR